jgi:hypothetical protein
VIRAKEAEEERLRAAVRCETRAKNGYFARTIRRIRRRAQALQYYRCKVKKECLRMYAVPVEGERHFGNATYAILG